MINLDVSGLGNGTVVVDNRYAVALTLNLDHMARLTLPIDLELSRQGVHHHVPSVTVNGHSSEDKCPHGYVYTVPCSEPRADGNAM